ncbi:putative reverse transcriptase domain-containing protein [Tanacetum coccineum]
MASFDYRLNPLYTIKECSSCGALYTTDYCCSKGGLIDKIIRERPPQNCATCGDPVDGLYCRPCAFVRKCLNEGWFTIHDKNEILNTSESSNDDTNVVSAPQEPFVFNQDPDKNSSQSPPHIDHHCCYECGDSLDDIFCQRCTCKSCGKGAHYAYNCPPQIPIISNSEPYYNQNLNEILQNLQSLQQQCLLGTCQQCGCNEYDGVCFYCTVGNGTQINFSTPYSSNDSPNFANHPPQNFQNFQQQYPCCENYGGSHETYQCQPMNEDYYHEQNSCYDPNSFGFDQFQPPQYTVNHPIFNAQNSLLNSQNKLIEQMTSICDVVGQIMQKKEEEKRIAKEQAAKARYWKILICYDDDDDEESSIPLKDIIMSELPPCVKITPVLLTEEPVDSLIMEDEHLDTIPATKLDGVIKSSVEKLVPIPCKSEGIPDKMCDVPVCDNPTPLKAFKEHFEIAVSSNDDSTLSDDDSPYDEDIDYVDASPLDSELVSLEVVEIVIPKVVGIDIDILLTIKDDILHEKLLNVNLLIAKIKALKDNPTPSSDVMTKSSSTSPNFFLEETNTVDNSLPKTETFRFNLEEMSSDSTTTRSDLSLPYYEVFYLDDDHVEEKSSGSTTTHANFSLPKYDSFIFDLSINPFPPVDRSDVYHEEFAGKLAHIISPPEYDCFYFKNEPELGEITMDVVEDNFDNPTREPRVYVPNILPTHPTLHLDSDFTLSSDSLGSDLVVSFPSGTRNKIFDPRIFIRIQSMIFLSRDEFSISFIRDPPLPMIDTLLPFSSENENKVVNTSILVSKEKSPPSLSHWGFKASKLSHHKSPMLIHEDNTPNLGVRHPHFYPLDKLKYGGIGSSLVT